MLSDFMAHDPVIKGHDPHEVTDTFNQISQFAPRVDGQPMMTAALMRRALQGQREPFEVNEIAKADKAVGDIHPHYIKPEPVEHNREFVAAGARLADATVNNAAGALKGTQGVAGHVARKTIGESLGLVD